MRNEVRPPEVAGRFYPANPDELRATVKRLLQEAAAPPGPPAKAIIAPHAGYIFSGTVAASAYAQLAIDADRVQRVVLIGPAHFVAFEGLAVSTASAFATPLGRVAVDTAAVQRLMTKAGVVPLDKAHKPEHSIEVQLPFLQVVLPHFEIVPLLVGEATAEQVGEVVDALWGGAETRFVISSDLSHYLDYEEANRVDNATAEAIAELAIERIGKHQACGQLPVCGFLGAAKRHKLKGRMVELRNSADAGGSRAQVVGYGAFAFADA